MRKWSGLEEHHIEWQAHRELLQIAEDSTSQQMLKSERKGKPSFYMALHICCIMLYMMDLKSMVYSLEKLYSGLDPDDATMCK